MAGKIRNGMIFILSLCMVALACIPVLAAQEPAFRLDTDSLNLQKGASSNIVISLINAQEAQIISIDGIENFDILSQSQSSYTSIVNNAATYQLDVVCLIMPKAAGEFTLKANIKYNGQNYETNSLQVTVAEGSDNQGGDVADLFVKTVFSHDEAYLGEKIVVTYELYSRGNVDSLGFTDYIAIDGAIVKESDNDQLKTESVYIDGNRYTMYEVKQLIIDPIKTGVCIIPSFNLQVNVIAENNFGGPFGGLMRSTTPKYLQSEERELLVKPLPQEGRPSDFSGVVGELKLEGHYSRDEVNYGDSIALQIEAYGNCNVDGLKSIASGGIPDFAVYETQKDTVESIEDNQYHVKKTFDTILIPEKTGVLDVSPISVSYFNPVSGKYETAQIPGAEIKVLGDIPVPNVNNDGQGGVVETVYISQVSYADVSDGYSVVQIQKDWIYVAAVVSCSLILLLAALLWLTRHRKKQDATLKTMYKKLMGAGDINEIYNMFNAMIKHCFNLNLKASSQDVIRNSLHDDDLASQVTDIMDYMESTEARDEKNKAYLKGKIKGIYTAKLRKA